ncbi:MAG: alpha-hydroxy acid oxidase [Phycisphaerales bacterium]
MGDERGPDAARRTRYRLRLRHGSRTAMHPQNLIDIETFARERLSKVVYDYFRSGAWDESTLRRNREAFGEIELLPRVLVDVSRRSASRTLLGTSLSMPVLAAPTAFHRLAHPDGEAATARAVAAAGSIMVLSSLSTTSIEEVVAQGGTVWFQLYANKDPGITKALMDRAIAAGCKALMLTADTPVWGVRERDVRNGFRLPAGVSAVNLASLDPTGDLKSRQGSGMGQAFDWMVHPALAWPELERICASSSVPVLLKGVARGDDAAKALDSGCAGVVVSNHGGRQLDGTPATIDMLPAVVEAVAGRGLVLVDGGVRRGTDVLKAIALGADAVQIGRPQLWGLASGGELGVRRVFEMLAAELDIAMALAGCATVADVPRDLVRWRREPPPR